MFSLKVVLRKVMPYLILFIVSSIVYFSNVFPPLIKVILHLAFFILFSIMFSKEMRIDFITDREKKGILTNMSILFAAGLVASGIAALIELSGADITPSLSIPFVIILIETIIIMTIGGTIISFFIYGGLKWIFNASNPGEDFGDIDIKEKTKNKGKTLSIETLKKEFAFFWNLIRALVGRLQMVNFKLLSILQGIFLIVTAILLPIYFNEAVQPIGSPRISTISTDPLYIQSLYDVNEKGDVAVEYYQISKITYEIQPPMFRNDHWICRFLINKILDLLDIRCDDRLKIDFPENVEIFTPGSGFWDKNPYIPAPKRDNPPFNQMFINSKDIDHIFVKVGPTAANVKTVPFRFYYREKVSMSCSSPGYSVTFWWNKYGSSLEEIPRVDCSTRPIARGWLQPQDRRIMYNFWELVLSNRGNLDIRGFVTTIPTALENEVCEDDKEVTLIGSGDKRQHISVDLKSGETRRMLILNQFSEEKSREESRYPAWQPKEFNFTRPGCNGDWKNKIF